MDKYICDDKNGLWYELQGDYYIPCLILPAEKEQPIGLWGQRHLRYLKEHHRATYITLLTSGRLNAYLADIDNGKAHSADETGAGYHGAIKGRKRFGMDTENEQHTSMCKGDCKQGNHLYIDLM